MTSKAILKFSELFETVVKILYFQSKFYYRFTNVAVLYIFKKLRD